MKTIRNRSGFTLLKHTALVAVACLTAHSALAGGAGTVLYDGNGRVTADILYKTVKTVAVDPPSLGASGTVNKANPLATAQGGNIPTGVYSRAEAARLTSWYLKKTAVVGTSGATAGNDTLDASVDASECAVSYEVTATIEEHGRGLAYFVLNGTATFGTAFRYVGYEYANPVATRDELEQFAKKKFEVTLSGPFKYPSDDGCSFKIPFIYNGKPEELQIVSDSIAKSIAFEIVQPANITFNCGDLLEYKPLEVLGGCGALGTPVFSPEADELPLGTWTPVTVTLTDSQGNQAVASFQAIRYGADWKGFQSPLKGNSSCSSPLKVIKPQRNLPVKFDYTCNGSLPDTVVKPPFVEVFRVPDCNQPGNIVASGFGQRVAAVWNFQVDTSVLISGQTYQIVATLPDSTKQSVFIRIQ